MRAAATEAALRGVAKTASAAMEEGVLVAARGLAKATVATTVAQAAPRGMAATEAATVLRAPAGRATRPRG